MSRSLALLALCAVALLGIPRPPAPPVLPAHTASAPTPEDEWETEVPDPNACVVCCHADPDRLEEAKVARAIEADHIGAPTAESVAHKRYVSNDLRLAPIYVEPQPNPPEPCIVCPPWRPISRHYGRSGATKSKLIREFGGNADSERGVARGLEWLAAQQQPDGSWQFDSGERDDRVGATGLALLPFLGAGHTHKTHRDADLNKHRDAVSRGLDFLTRRCPPSGPNAGTTSADATAQAIATTALCEAYGMTKDGALAPHAQAALNRLQKMRERDGGWGDTDATGWAVQALLATRTSRDLVANDAVVKSAVAHLTATDARPGTTAAAVVHFGKYHFDDWGPSNPGFIAGANALFKQPPTRDPLHRYYASWVLLRADGEEWPMWNLGPKRADGVRAGGLRDQLLKGRDGDSWAAEGEWGERYGRLGTTALNLLTLEVYYRYMPVYKRSADGNAVPIRDGN